MRPRLRRRGREAKVGPPVKVASARNQAEAEFIQALLREEGVPSMVRRSAGFDVPDFLAAGPRDVHVPEAAADLARQILTEGRPRG
jgi:Putative prokaryotic signal transducing protein